MRKRFPNIVRLLLALALLGSLVAITAAPVSAQSCTFAPTSGPVGTLITVTDVGAGWTAAETFTVTVGGVTVITHTLTVPVGGAIEGTITVPAGAPVGLQDIVITGSTNSFTGAFTVESEVTLGGAAAPPGTGVTISGASWTPGAKITLSLAGTAVTTIPADMMVGTGGGSTPWTPGEFSGAFVVPLMPGRLYPDGLRVTDGALTAYLDFTVTPVVTFSPAATTRGAEVTVEGMGFTPNLSVDITDGASGSGTVATDGTFSVVATAVTAAAITAKDGAGLSATSAALVLLPSVVLYPTSGLAGSAITVTGYNFTDVGEGQILITENTIEFALVPGSHANGMAADLDLDGAYNDFTLSVVVPAELTPGDKKVVVEDTGQAMGTATFTVVGRPLSLTPASGPRGTLVTVTGTNMTPGSKITAGNLKFGGIVWNIDKDIAIDSNGVISPTTLVVPCTAIIGTNLVIAKDDEGLFASAYFTVTQATITLSPVSGPKGTVITISGAGWVPGTRGAVDIDLAGATVRATTVADGSFGAALTVPVAADVGANPVMATDGLCNSATATVTVPPPTLTLEPTEGPAGTVVTATGTAFDAQWPVTLTIAEATIATTPAMLVTDTLGGFTATFTIPGLVGVQPVTATTAGETSATTFFTITAAPTTVATALAGISDELVRVWGYSAGAWQMHDPADPIGSDLTSLTEGRGYWLKVSADVTLIYGGYSYDLTAGWNLVGWR